MLSGRVEICIESTWTTICDKFWDNKEASVVCRQLEFSPYGTLCTIIDISLNMQTLEPWNIETCGYLHICKLEKM